MNNPIQGEKHFLAMQAQARLMASSPWPKNASPLLFGSSATLHNDQGRSDVAMWNGDPAPIVIALVSRSSSPLAAHLNHQVSFRTEKEGLWREPTVRQECRHADQGSRTEHPSRRFARAGIWSDTNSSLRRHHVRTN